MVNFDVVSKLTSNSKSGPLSDAEDEEDSSPSTSQKRTWTVTDFLDHIPIAPVRIPIIEWLPTYTKEIFYKDFIAGITVFVFLVPQGMAYALLSGLPAVYGLYSSTFPLYIYAIFSTSRQLAMGPMAITSLLLGVTCQKFGYEDGSPEYIAIAMSVSMIIGFLMIFLGLGRLGSLSNMISGSVLTGFLTASALVIAITQLKYIMGIKMPRFAYSHQTIIYLMSHISESNPYAILLGIGTTLLLLGVREWKKRNKVTAASPMYMRVLAVIGNLSNFLSIVVGAVVARSIVTQGGVLQIVGDVPSGLLAPSFHIVDLPMLIKLFPSAFAIAFVSFAGNWAVATKYAALNGYRVEATQELIASGLAIAIGVFFNAFIVSGGLARTAVNAESGATTQLSMCITATLILLSLLFLTSFFYYIPMAVLSAVIEVSVISLIDFESMVKAYKIDKRDSFVMILTFLFTFFVGVTEGLFMGMFLSIAVVMKSTAFPHIVHLGRLPGEGGNYRDIHRFLEAEQIPGFAIIRMDASLLFSNCSHFKEVAIKAAKGKFHSHKAAIHTVIVDASAWIDIDLIGVQTLFDLKDELQKMNGIKLALACTKGVIRDRLRKNNFTTSLTSSCFNLSIEDAVQGRPAYQSFHMDEQQVQKYNQGGGGSDKTASGRSRHSGKKKGYQSIASNETVSPLFAPTVDNDEKKLIQSSSTITDEENPVMF